MILGERLQNHSKSSSQGLKIHPKSSSKAIVLQRTPSNINFFEKLRFQKELENRILGVIPHAIVYNDDSIENYEELIEKINVNNDVYEAIRLNTSVSEINTSDYSENLDIIIRMPKGTGDISADLILNGGELLK